MINVIASIRIVPGKMSDAMQVYKHFAPLVNAERGCAQYLPTLDLLTNLPTQHADQNTVTVIEKWKTMEDFRAHLVAPHVETFRSDMKGILEEVSIKVLQDAL